MEGKCFHRLGDDSKQQNEMKLNSKKMGGEGGEATPPPPLPSVSQQSLIPTCSNFTYLSCGCSWIAEPVARQDWGSWGANDCGCCGHMIEANFPIRGRRGQRGCV